MRASRGVRGGTGLVRIGRRRRFFGSPREALPDPRNCRQGRGSAIAVRRGARKIRRDFLGDRVAHSDVPHLPAGPPSRKAPRLRTGTPRRRSGLRLRRNGPTRPCPSSRSWRGGEAITRGAFATARIGSGGIRGTREAADDARGRASLRGAADCDGAANPPEDLPPTFVVALGKTKLGGSFAHFAGRPVVSFGYDNGARSRLVITSFAARGANACPRRLAVAATRPCASTRPRRYVPSLRRRTRATLPSPDRRAKPVVPKSGDADRARPVQKAASCGPRGTDRDEACFPRARLPLRPPRDTSTDAVASRPPRASSVPRDAR